MLRFSTAIHGKCHSNRKATKRVTSSKRAKNVNSARQYSSVTLGCQFSSNSLNSRTTLSHTKPQKNFQPQRKYCEKEPETNKAKTTEARAYLDKIVTLEIDRRSKAGELNIADIVDLRKQITDAYMKGDLKIEKETFEEPKPIEDTDEISLEPPTDEERSINPDKLTIFEMRTELELRGAKIRGERIELSDRLEAIKTKTIEFAEEHPHISKVKRAQEFATDMRTLSSRLRKTIQAKDSKHKPYWIADYGNFFASEPQILEELDRDLKGIDESFMNLEIAVVTLPPSETTVSEDADILSDYWVIGAKNAALSPDLYGFGALIFFKPDHNGVLSYEIQIGDGLQMASDIMEDGFDSEFSHAINTRDTLALQVFGCMGHLIGSLQLSKEELIDHVKYALIPKKTISSQVRRYVSKNGNFLIFVGILTAGVGYWYGSSLIEYFSYKMGLNKMQQE